MRLFILIILTSFLTSCASNYYQHRIVKSSYTLRGTKDIRGNIETTTYTNKIGLEKEFMEFYKDKRINDDSRVSCYAKDEPFKGARSWNFMYIARVDVHLFRPFLVDRQFVIEFKRVEELTRDSSKDIPKFIKTQTEKLQGTIRAYSRSCWIKIFKTDKNKTYVTSEVYY